MLKPIFTSEHVREADVLEELLSDTITGDRRRFLKKGSLAVGAMALATSWFASTKQASAQTMKTDLQMLQESYTLEQLAVNTYSVAATLKPSEMGEPYISGPILSVAAAFIGDHTAHATRFAEVIAQLGGTVPTASTGTTLEAFPPGPNSQLTSTAGILRYALAVEVYAAKLWYDYFKQGQDLRVKRVFADLAPNEAAHAAILRAALKFVLPGGVPDYDNADAGKAVVPFTQLSFDAPKF